MKKLTPYLLTLLRVAVGWHFLYEGVSKIIVSDWSAAPYLSGSRWIFASFFEWMAGSEAVITVADFLNIWGLILVGVALVFGLLSRWAALGGTLMLLMYFLVYPPIPGYMFGGMPEVGNYLWVNMNLIEFFALFALAVYPAKQLFGIDRLISNRKEENARQPIPDFSDDLPKNNQRRELLKNLIGIPVFGIFAYALYREKKWNSFEEKLLEIDGIDANKRVSTLQFNYKTLKKLKGQVPHAAIRYTDKNGNPAQMELSRLIMGGNLIGGWAHSRDLIYVSRLVKEYHTDEKIMQTLALGDKCGINAIISNPQHGRIFQMYKHEFKSNMKFISDCGIDLDFQKGIAMSLASDFDALYCQGEITDRWANEQYDDGTGKTVAQRMELIRQGLDEIRSHGKPAGIGAHKIEAIKVCVDHGLKPDFWVKTCHSHNYWSAQSETLHDNIFDYDPEETIRFMETLDKPWIAFKVLAAGAIKPEVGLEYAYRNGADYVCLGMYDFQVVDDVNIALDAFAKAQNRTRKWIT